MIDGRLVEFAGAASNVPFPMSDDEARERCRSAPAHIRRSIDNHREARGLRRLWTPDGKHPASATPARLKTEPAIPDRVLLVGVCAPGLSAVPVRVATDGELLRERITPAAFEGVVRAVKAGASVVRLTDGHGGDTLADTKTGTLQLAVDGVAGLIIQAVVPVKSLHRQLLADAFDGWCGLSIGLRPARMHLKRENGERVRVVQELAALDHVAVIRAYAGQGEPCYRTKVFAALTSDQQAMKMARAKAVVAALEDILKQKRQD
jgi:hypothetical protein